MALLLTREKRESWTGLVSGLSPYYQSPGRLAVLRRRFESAFRRSGLDPATFATELGILAILRPAKDFQSVPQKDSNTRTRGVQKTIVTPLSALAENFIPRKTSRKPPTPQMPTDNELDRSFARTGPGKIETPQDIIEIDIATVGAASPAEIEKPVAMADVAGASGLAITGAGGPVVAGTWFLAVTDVAGASGRQ